MTAALQALVAAGLFLSPAAQPAPDGGAPQQGRCHMDACTWSVIREEQLAGRKGRYRLFRVLVQSGSSAHPDGAYPDHYMPGLKIDWKARPHEMFVLCAPQMPAVMVRSSRGFDVSVLDFAGGLFGYQMGSEGIYASACHGRWMTARQLKQLYPKPPLRGPGRVARPSDIFDHLTAAG